MKTIYCDLDGVHFDFIKGFRDNFDAEFQDTFVGTAWKKIKECDGFWENLERLPDSEELWNYIKPYNPIILTGVPTSGRVQAEEGKALAVDTHLDGHGGLITCFSRNKQKHMDAEGAILIDDTQKIIDRWIESGGIGILHVNAQDTIAQLKELGF